MTRAAERGEPKTIYVKHVHLPLWDRAGDIAEAEGRSMSGIIALALIDWLSKYDGNDHEQPMSALRPG
jgi:hypothetical protein